MLSPPAPLKVCICPRERLFQIIPCGERLYLLPACLTGVTALLPLSCSLPHTGCGQLAPACGEGAGEGPRAALTEPGGTYHKDSLGLPASTTLKDRERPAPELPPFHCFFLLLFQQNGDDGVPLRRGQSWTWMNNTAPQNPPECTLGRVWTPHSISQITGRLRGYWGRPCSFQ